MLTIFFTLIRQTSLTTEGASLASLLYERAMSPTQVYAAFIEEIFTLKGMTV